MRKYMKSPKSAQKALGCLPLYTAASPSSSTSAFEHFLTSPMRTTRPSAAPSKPLAVTVSAALASDLLSARRSLVCDDIPEKQNTGRPLESVAKPTSAPDGYPSTCDDSVERTA